MLCSLEVPHIMKLMGMRQRIYISESVNVARPHASTQDIENTCCHRYFQLDVVRTTSSHKLSAPPFSTLPRPVLEFAETLYKLRESKAEIPSNC